MAHTSAGAVGVQIRVGTAVGHTGAVGEVGEPGLQRLLWFQAQHTVRGLGAPTCPAGGVAAWSREGRGRGEGDEEDEEEEEEGEEGEEGMKR